MILTILFWERAWTRKHTDHCTFHDPHFLILCKRKQSSKAYRLFCFQNAWTGVQKLQTRTVPSCYSCILLYARCRLLKFQYRWPNSICHVDIRRQAVRISSQFMECGWNSESKGGCSSLELQFHLKLCPFFSSPSSQPFVFLVLNLIACNCAAQFRSLLIWRNTNSSKLTNQRGLGFFHGIG